MSAVSGSPDRFCGLQKEEGRVYSFAVLAVKLKLLGGCDPQKMKLPSKKAPGLRHFFGETPLLTQKKLEPRLSLFDEYLHAGGRLASAADPFSLQHFVIRGPGPQVLRHPRRAIRVVEGAPQGDRRRVHADQRRKAQRRRVATNPE